MAIKNHHYLSEHIAAFSQESTIAENRPRFQRKDPPFSAILLVVMSNPILSQLHQESRRQFFAKAGGLSLGALGLNHVLGAGVQTAPGLAPGQTHFPAKAKRIIYLFQSGGPSQMDLFDYKPKMTEMRGQELPASIRMGQRLTGMTSKQSSFPVASSIFDFKQHGQSGAWISELMPHLAKQADDVCFIKSVYTNAINHDPGITYLQTGHEQPGRPSLGSWMSYGIGSENENLPAFVVLVSNGNFNQAQPIYSRLWGSGFLPTSHQGVRLRSGSDPVLFLQDPGGAPRERNRDLLDGISQMNQLRFGQTGDAEIQTRISQYEMAYRMQMSVPDVTDLSDEPESTFERYGEAARQPGSYAANCLLARRLAEKDVRFIQLYHTGWDQHSKLPEQLALRCEETDQGTAALLADLKERGLLDDTLVIWGGEFGRSIYSQGTLTDTNYGRDHHPRCFTMWMAGAGVKPGMSYGVTDDFCYNVAENPVAVHDLQATILHLSGIDHERLTYFHQGRRFRLTDVHGHVVKDILT